MAMLVAVVLVAILAYAVPTPTINRSRPQPVEIIPAAALIACPTDLAWSPDLSMIAIVGYSIQCVLPDTTYFTGLHDVTTMLYEDPLHASEADVAIYDTHRGVRLEEFSPDKMIFQAMHSQGLITLAFTTWLATVNLGLPRFGGVGKESGNGRHVFEGDW